MWCGNRLEENLESERVWGPFESKSWMLNVGQWGRGGCVRDLTLYGWYLCKQTRCSRVVREPTMVLILDMFRRCDRAAVLLEGRVWTHQSASEEEILSATRRCSK